MPTPLPRKGFFLHFYAHDIVLLYAQVIMTIENDEINVGEP